MPRGKRLEYMGREFVPPVCVYVPNWVPFWLSNDLRGAALFVPPRVPEIEVYLWERRDQCQDR